MGASPQESDALCARAFSLTSTMVAMNSEETRNNYYDDPDALEGIFTEHVYTVQEGVVTPVVE